MRISNRGSVSMGPAAWVITGLVLSPFLVIWLAIKVLILAGQGINWLIVTHRASRQQRA